MPHQLAKHLIAKALLPEAMVKQALEKHSREGGTFDTVLLELHAISEAGMLQTLADVSGLRLVNLADFEPNLDAASLMPAQMAHQLNVVPLSAENAKIHVATAYPVPQAQLKNASALLGKPLELWIALECRVRDWQSVIYGEEPEARFRRLLEQLDPERPRAPLGVRAVRHSEMFSPEVLERISRGLVEEPILLDKPKRPPASDLSSAMESLGDSEDTKTALAESLAYSRFVEAAQTFGEDTVDSDEVTSVDESTRVIEVSDYQTFAQKIFEAEAPPPNPPLLTAAETAGSTSTETTVPEGLSEAAARSTASSPNLSDEIDFSSLNDDGGAASFSPLPAPHVQAEVTGAKPRDEQPDPRWTLAAATEALKQATGHRDAMLQVVLDYAHQTFEFSAVFAVVRGAALGWDARPRENAGIVRQVTIPLDAPSIFRTVALTRANYLGPPPAEEHSQHYLSLFHRNPRTVLLWPVEVQSRLAVLVYGDCGTKPVSQRRLADFLLFCQELPQAFLELILMRKEGRKPALFASSPSGPMVSPLPSAQETAALIEQLVGPDIAKRKLARHQLLMNPESSARALAAAFPGPTGWSRLPVSDLPEADELGPIPGAVARLGPAGAFALAPLLTHLNGDTRYLALLTAGNLPYSPVVYGLTQGLFDEESDVSSAARASARALRHLPEMRATFAELRRKLDSPDGLTRSLAARALGALRDRDAVEKLISLTGSDDALCAQSAAEALKEITRCDFGPRPDAWAGWWISGQQRRRAEWLVDALNSGEFELRLAAIEELAAAFHDDFGYRPDSPAGERQMSLERWKQAVERRPELTL